MGQIVRLFFVTTASLGLLSLVGYGQDAQSLGEAARQTRQQRQKNPLRKDSSGKDVPAPRVITNEDVPEHPQASAEAGTATGHGSPDAGPSQNPPRVPPDVWKAQIQAQKGVLNNLQQEIDRLNSSIHFVQANLYVNGAQHNQRQAEKEQELERLQLQLDEQKKRLEDMQETARKQGYGSSIYDP